MANKASLVSVVMPVQNEEAYVAQAIASILQQSFPDFELIIIDDGSTDKTPHILSLVSDSRVRVVRSAKSKGLAASLNLAIALAKGQYIARMDADDLCEPNRLEDQLNLMERFPNLGLVGSWYVIITEAGRPLWERRLPTGGELDNSFLAKNPFCHGSVLFKKGVIDRVGPYRSEFQYAQDLDLWLRIRDWYEMDNVPKFLYKWRLQPEKFASMRWLQRRYRDLAHECMACRQKGEPEPLWKAPLLQNAPLASGEFLLDKVKKMIWPFLIGLRIDPEWIENLKLKL
jgi:glycosyltransferase involved in cell wall biosynthesis